MFIVILIFPFFYSISVQFLAVRFRATMSCFGLFMLDHVHFFMSTFCGLGGFYYFFIFLGWTKRGKKKIVCWVGVVCN